MRDPKLVAGRGIKISVEHAIAVAELELEAGAFPDLQRGAAKVLDDFVDGEAGQLRGRARLRVACRVALTSGTDACVLNARFVAIVAP